MSGFCISIELPSIRKWAGKTGNPLAGVVVEEIAAPRAMESTWFVILCLKRQTRKVAFAHFVSDLLLTFHRNSGPAQKLTCIPGAAASPFAASPFAVDPFAAAVVRLPQSCSERTSRRERSLTF
jgi:hypothetical protein